MKSLKGLTIIICVVLTCTIMYKNSHFNNQKYEVLEVFGLSHGSQVTIWMEGDCILLKDGEPIASTSSNEKGKEFIATHKGVYKLIELKK